MNLSITVDRSNPDGRVSYQGHVLPAKQVEVQLAAGCVPTAQVLLQTAALDLKQVDGKLYMFLGDHQFRVVDERKYEVIRRSDSLESGRGYETDEAFGEFPEYPAQDIIGHPFETDDPKGPRRA